MRPRSIPAIAALALCFLGGAAAGEEAPRADLFDDFRQIIPRGTIPAIDDPHFVGAAEAEISDDAWVLGVEIDGQARAYSLNLLNRHEIVNDSVGESLFAAVW